MLASVHCLPSPSCQLPALHSGQRDGFLGAAGEKQRAEDAEVGLSHSLDLSTSGG